MENATDSNVGSPEWLSGIRNSLGAGLARLQNPPPSPAPLEAAAHHAIGHLVEIEKELKKGSPLIVANADRLRRVYHDRLIALGRLDDALQQRTADDAFYVRLAALDTPAAASAATPVPTAVAPLPAVPAATTAAFGATAPAPATSTAIASPPPVPAPVAGPAPAVAFAAANPQAAVSGCPLFSTVSQEYIDMRIGADGADHKEIPALRLRRQLFLELIGDFPVDHYNGKHLQAYVNKLQFWPGHAGERSELKGLSIREIIDGNQDRHLEPLALKTAQDGYVANLKTMIRSGLTIYGYKDPFAGVRIHWPDGFTPSKPREEIDATIMNETFRLGVESGLLDNAILPLLSALTSRRLGLLCYLQGRDIREKHGVKVAQTSGIVFVHGVWKRVPIKTADSMTFFVLHEKLSEIGFVDWASRQPGFIFEAIHEYDDPSKSSSKNMNRLMRRAGAKGGVEVFHCLRGDAITDMREHAIDGRARRLQAGHALGDEHEKYGLRSIVAAECKRLASAEITRAIDWSIFENIDFDKFAAARRGKE